MKSLLLASAVLLLCASPALAQDEAEAAITTAANVIYVFGQGLPDTPATPAYSVVEISREQLTATVSGRLEDALGNVAGFQQFRRSDSRSANPSAQGATLRALGGNASSRTLLLLDGVPMADPFFGYIPFNALVPDRLSVVRVTRGGGCWCCGGCWPRGRFGACGSPSSRSFLPSADRSSPPSVSAASPGRRRGRWTLKTLPEPTPDSTSMRPLCRDTIP